MIDIAQKPHYSKADVTSSTGLSHGSLFSGIGGFELGAEMSGIETKWNCEVSDFNRNQLKRLYPNAKQYDDIRTMQGAESVDIISGGFPCQNISLAASKNRTGVDGDKSGLWRDMLRICGEIRPKYIILENSHTIIKHGFEIILEEFAKIGYDAEWQTLQGFQFGIPQRRRRIYATLPHLHRRQDGGKGNFHRVAQA
jgi:DNA (cytosine-5)-methyltransferase 1